MGKAVSKVASDIPVKKVAEALQDTAAAAATHTKRKLQKEGQQFMASQRMDKVINEQKKVPKRAPMNLGKIEISEELKTEKLKEAQLGQQEDAEYLSLMKNVFVTSRDPEISHLNQAEENPEERKGPTNTRSKLDVDVNDIEVPKGRALVKDIIAALYNHQMDPKAWGPADIASKINIRETDAKNILENFELFKNTSIISPKYKTVSKNGQKHLTE